ncbi:hypothetical protein [Streptomyces lavendulae]|uniref:hypothetical protein n=1 Tax=Streptomyces lavendulae TaxID=1914 RepID=UPI0033C0BCD0
MHAAHPPRTRWHIETYDPAADEWSSGLPLTSSRDAVKKRVHLDEHHPTWPDGAPIQRRLVLETTTYEDFDADVSHLALFPKSGFIITGVGNQDFAALPDQTPDGRPAIRYAVGSSETGHADVVLPLDQLEEVVAGLREIARQQGGAQPAPRRRLTELEHTAAWHAIEGTAGEPGADPGTVLAAVLRALDIDPPADQTLLTPPSEQRAQLLGEISVPIEEALRAAGHPAAADRIVGIICDLARRASQTTQHAFALTSGGPGPSAAEGAGA